MRINQFGDPILDETDIVRGLYSGNITASSLINVDNATLFQQFNNSIDKNADSIKHLNFYQEPNCSVEENDKKNQEDWFIPEEYKNLDIAKWLLDQCQTESEYLRVAEELELYVYYNMINILLCVKYLVDYMRDHNIVWGVGRGSSVASYCLYLIGLHKVDSIKYQLDIKEFLKEE